ncbi:hypothetical protein [Pseudomonas syringae]|uniref:hypothetical protein n=1 Tax=Pseudomonas syringae TaxID=317 RepID=UPI002462E15A|nr:hypothetical protein [Pseudomonas syringae]MDH4602460.1 hypothetical protein [Pseudomonas syringae pv. papulans]
MKNLNLGTVLNASVAGKLISGLWLSNAKLRTPGLEVLTRSDFTCKFCGFISKPTDNVPHAWMLPVNPSNPGLLVLRQDDGICLCPFCASSMAINWSVAPKDLGTKQLPAPGMLINMPHMTQEQVNRVALHVVSVLACRKVNKQSSVEIAAINIDNAFVSLNTDLAGTLPIYRYGEDAGFARALALLPEEFYQFRDEIIGPIRWWPSVNHWREQGLYWMESTYADIHKSV